MQLPRLLAPFLIAGLVVTSAACSKDKSDAGKEKRPAAAAGDRHGGTKAKSVISPPLTAQPRLAHPEGIRADATMASCDTEPGDVTAKGTVKNASSKSADIVITVNWTNANSDVVARGVATLEDVKPKASVDWKADTKLAKGYGKVDCLLNVRRGTLA